MRFQATAFSSPVRHSHAPPLIPRGGLDASSSQETTAAPTSIRRSRRRQPPCRSYSALFASFDGSASSGGDEERADGLPEGTPSSSSSSDGVGDGAAANPEPRADEKITDSLADAAAAAAGTVDSSAPMEDEAAAAASEEEEEEQIDWDKAWASTRQRMEKEQKAAPIFSGRKQVVASKNEEGGYDFEEISADGSSRMKGDKGSGGFGFADSSQAEDGPGRVRRQEQQAVNLATTNQVRFSPPSPSVRSLNDERRHELMGTTSPAQGLKGGGILFLYSNRVIEAG